MRAGPFPGSSSGGGRPGSKTAALGARLAPHDRAGSRGSAGGLRERARRGPVRAGPALAALCCWRRSGTDRWGCLGSRPVRGHLCELLTPPRSSRRGACVCVAGPGGLGPCLSSRFAGPCGGGQGCSGLLETEGLWAGLGSLWSFPWDHTLVLRAPLSEQDPRWGGGEGWTWMATVDRGTCQPCPAPPAPCPGGTGLCAKPRSPQECCAQGSEQAQSVY